MKNNKKYFKYICSFFILFITICFTNAKADTAHNLNIKMIKCDGSKYNSFATQRDYKSCYNDYVSGKLSSYVINTGDEVDTGTVILTILNYTPGSPKVITSINTRINIDTDVLTPIVKANGSLLYYQTTYWPEDSNYSTSFNYNSTSGIIGGSFVDSEDVPLTAETELLYFFLKINDSATGTIPIEFSKKPGDNDMTDFDGNQYEFTTTDANVKIPGESLSHDASLGTLTVTNGSTTYPLSPAFVSGSVDNKSYTAVVPNDIEYINLNATANHSKASILSGILGKNNINVGENSFTITVTSEFGNTEVYTLNVYRLSNDATLSSINLTNGVSFGNLISGTYSYSTTIPYAITSTSVSATPTHANAYVDSGLGTWNLSNSGTLSNNKVLVVKAENCLSKYSSVPGNSCTSQNYNLAINRQAASDNSYLKSLTVDGVSVSNFNKTKQEYDLGTVANNKSSMLLNALVDDTGKASVSGIGTVNLNIGENNFTITVTAEDKSTREYKIKVYRLSNENKLSSLTITSSPQATMSPAFTSTFNGAYTYNYDATVTDITVSATVLDTGKARVSIYDLEKGESSSSATLNTQSKTFGIETKNVYVVVTSEDGTVNTYTIDLTRTKSSDNSLKSLIIDNGTLTPSFNSATRTYTAEVEGNITSINVNAIPNSLYGKIKSITGNTNLNFGNNQIEIIVEAENGNTSSYIINVTRKQYDISTLDDIKIDGVSIENFNKDTKEYDLKTVNFEKDSINIETTKSNSYATVSGDGLVSLKTGNNKIVITVTAQNGIGKSEYVLNLYREKNNDTSISNLKVKGIEAKNTDVGIYEVTVPNDVTILTPSDVIFDYPSDATIVKSQTLTLLTTEVNDYRFKVIAEDSTEQEYSIKVTRTASNDSSLNKVTLIIGKDDSRYCLMNSDNTCRIEVPVDTLQFNLEADIASTASVVPSNDTVHSMPANESSKSITLTVTAEDGTTTVYTVNVERQKSSNANLSDLKVNGQTIEGFNSSKQTYEISVPGTIDKALIEATVEDTDKAVITTDLSNQFDLEFDKQNKIEISVQAENKTVKTYTIYITRNHRQDITLKDLTINGVTISDFTSTKDEYTLSELPYNTHQLNIVATPNDELATKTGDGLVRINTGNNDITITVYAHDTSIYHDYVIHVSRKLNDDAGIKEISLSGNKATYNSSTKKYEVTVPNNIEEVNASNLIVNVNDPITSSDKKATVAFDTTPILTTSTNDITIKVKAEDGTVKDYILSVTRTKSNIATLDSLTVTNGSFNPSFSKDTLEYSVTVPVETTEFNVSGVTTESHANITSGVGHYTMTESSTRVEVVVVSEDLSATNTYILNITRTKSSVNTLSDITVSEGTLTPTFASNKTSYTVNVAGDIDSIEIGATLTDSRAKILSGTGTHQLNVGSNTITIEVESESGAKQNYTINVIRAKKLNNNLATLKVDGISVKDFDKDTLEYTLDDVLYSKTSIDISATAEDEDATIEGVGTKGLKTGLNEFNIVVTAQNGDKKTYTIKINRAKNDNANLSLLAVSGYVLVPTFDSEIYDYEVTVDAIKEKLLASEVTAEPEDSNATVEKPEEISLSTTNDNYYIIKVTAENGNVKTYTIKVIRPKSSDATIKEVKLTGATISPAFTPNNKDYVLTVPYGKTDFRVEAIANVKTTTITGNGNYKLSDGKVIITSQAEDGTVLVYNFTIVEALSNDATLSDLNVSGYPLDKTFYSTTLNYSIGDLPYGTTQLRINATPNNALSTIEYYVDGVKQESNIVNIPEILGSKTISVKVLANDKVTIQTYNISYNIVASDNSYLSKLVSSVGTIDFIKTNPNYSITVDNEITSVDLTLETEDKNATVTVNGTTSFTPKTVTISDLNIGNNSISILVTAQNATTRTYNLVIKRLDKQASNDAYLSSLSVDGYEFDKEFTMNQEEYSIGQIPFETDKLTVNATANMGTSKISYLVNGIKQDSNVVTIPKIEGTSAIVVQVTAEDGKTVKNYKITYTKTASTNAYLSNIIVSKGNLSFNKNTFAYTVNVDRTVSSIDVTAMTADSTAIMKINGVTYTSPHTITISPLDAGTTELIILNTAQNGTVLTYKVTIIKEADPASTITSNVFGHKIANGYIKTVKLGITGLDLKNQLDNENKYLEIWSSDETRKINDNDTLATGMIVKLMIDNEEKDRKYIVIKGDTSGDGEIDLFDAVKILNHYLVRTLLDGAYKEAAYVNDDTEIDLFDSVMILNHYLGRISLH